MSSLAKTSAKVCSSPGGDSKVAMELRNASRDRTGLVRMRTKLKPRRRMIHRRVRWMVRLPKSLQLMHGQKRYFDSKEGAWQFIDELEGLCVRFGSELKNVPLALVAEAVRCAEKLKAYKATLTEAVEFYTKHTTPAGETLTMAALAEEFNKSRKAKECRDTTLAEYRSQMRAITREFGLCTLAEVEHSDIEDWLEEMDTQPRTRRNHLKALQTLFRFAVRRGYCLANPALRVEAPICDDRPPGILTPEQARALLRAAVLDGCGLVAVIAIALFAGLRRSELFRLCGEEVDLEEDTIEVKAAKSKTRRRRLVTISPTLRVWLEAFPPSRGRVVSMAHIDSLGTELRRLAQLAGITDWPHNALRHTFGSHHYATHRNENLTAYEMGNTPEIVFKNYRALMKPSVAAAYGKILPEAHRGGVTPRKP